MRPEQTTTVKRRRRINWFWVIVAIVLASALVGWAMTPKPGPTGNSATSGAVQDSATGSQGAVGGFAEQVVPGERPQTTTGDSPLNNTPGFNTSPSGSQPGTVQGTDAGAGSSGVSTSTDSIGGSTPKGGADVNRLNEAQGGKVLPGGR
jgi:hypothetical protein